MKRRGYILLDIIIGIFFLGLVAITALPVLNTSFRNFMNVRKQNEMNYIAENVIENLNSIDQKSSDVFQNLESTYETEYLSLGSYKDKYECKIVLLKQCQYIWELDVIIYFKNQEDKEHHVRYRVSIPKK